MTPQLPLLLSLWRHVPRRQIPCTFEGLQYLEKAVQQRAARVPQGQSHKREKCYLAPGEERHSKSKDSLRQTSPQQIARFTQKQSWRLVQTHAFQGALVVYGSLSLDHSRVLQQYETTALLWPSLWLYLLGGKVEHLLNVYRWRNGRKRTGVSVSSRVLPSEA